MKALTLHFSSSSMICRLTMVEAIFYLLTMKQMQRMGTTAFNQHVKFLQLLLPDGNILPPSLHLMRRAIGCSNWSDYEEHVCDRDGCQGGSVLHCARPSLPYFFHSTRPFIRACSEELVQASRQKQIPALPRLALQNLSSLQPRISLPVPF